MAAVFLSRGWLHRRQNLPCQDVVSEALAPNGNQIMVVCDGCSASIYGLEAAKANCGAVTRLFSEITLEQFLALPEGIQRHAIIGYCMDAIRTSAMTIGDLQSKNYAATLLFAVTAGKLCLVGHLGDGAIYMLRDQGLALLRSAPESAGESSTIFTVSPAAADHLRLYAPDHVRSLLLTTDGAENALFSAEQAVITEVLSCETTSTLADTFQRYASDPVLHVDDWGVAVVHIPHGEAEKVPSPNPNEK